MRSGSSWVVGGVDPSSSVILDGVSAASWVALVIIAAVVVEGRRGLCIVKAWHMGANGKSEMMEEENFI